MSRTTASRWCRTLREQGSDGLKRRRATGRPCRLTAEQLRLIPQIVAEGAVVQGFPDNRWTTARLATVIEMRFGVHYDHDHVGRLMHKLGLRQPRARQQRALATAAAAGAPYAAEVYAASRYSPNTDLSRSEISPTVA